MYHQRPNRFWPKVRTLSHYSRGHPSRLGGRRAGSPERCNWLTACGFGRRQQGKRRQAGQGLGPGPAERAVSSFEHDLWLYRGLARPPERSCSTVRTAVPRRRPARPVLITAFSNAGFQRGATDGKHVPGLRRILAREGIGIGYFIRSGTIADISERLHKQSADVVRPLINGIGSGGNLIKSRTPTRRFRSGTILVCDCGTEDPWALGRRDFRQ